MNLSRWSFGNLPIWVKLAAAFSFAAMVPTLIGLVVIDREVTSADLRSLQIYITDEGEERRENVDRVFATAQNTLAAFVDSFVYRNFLISVMRGNPAVTTVDSLTQYIDGELVASGLFSQIVVINHAGEVVLSNGLLTANGRAEAVPSGTDVSGSLVYQAYRTMITLRDGYRLVVDDVQEPPTIEMIHVLYRVDEPIGYVVGTLNYETAIYGLFAQREDFVGTTSYLVTENGNLFVPQEQRESAQESARSSPIARAFSQTSGIESYNVGSREVMAYYAQIENTPFALIVEADATTSFTTALLDIYNRAPLAVFVMLVMAGGLAALASVFILSPLRSLQADIQAVGEGDFERPIEALDRQDEIGQLARTFANAREQMHIMIGDLQARITERVRDIQATQEVSRFAATQLDLQVLMDRVVDLMVDLFPNIYHAQIFLTDADNIFAVLRSSTGEAGRALLSRGHRLEVGGVSVIGQVTQEGRVVIARDAAASQIHRRNEFLPDTRAELAIPLRVADRIIGALDVQSKQSDSFTEDQVSILQTMADQIAIAIANARLYQESLQRIDELATSNRQTTQRMWKDHMNHRRQRALTSSSGVPTATDMSPLRQLAVTQGEAVVGATTENQTVPFAVPIILRGQILGAVEWELPSVDFSTDKVLLAQELVNRLAITLDNARLFQESRRAINRERLVNEIATKLTAQTDIDDILQTAVREVGQALRAPQVSIQINWQESAEQQNNGHTPTNNDG